MITPADVQRDGGGGTSQQRKSKRERRRDERRRDGDRQCEGCRHARMDHTPIKYQRATFCHACTEVCAPK